ncbi:MAG: flagellar basal body rod protein FlgC [Pseudomonadota bacterium]
MSLFRIMEIAGSALNVQTIRMNTTASNMANANSASSSLDETYRARSPVFSTMVDGFAFDEEPDLGVKVDGIVESEAPLTTEYNPSHPLANDEGYVFMPNVNVIEEMTNMISASRSYQTNIEIVEASKQMMQQALTLGQR